eukprot:g4290.t1
MLRGVSGRQKWKPQYLVPLPKFTQIYRRITEMQCVRERRCRKKVGSENTHWAEYKSVPEACKGVINMYEGYLAQQNGGKRGSITYQIQNLFKYIEQLPECAAFVMESKSGMYTPRGKNWLKTQILSHLKGEATKGSAGGRR